MDLDTSIPFSPLPICHFSGEDPQLSNRPEVHHLNDERTQMGDEGCPNDNPSSDDTTGYSQGEDEAFAQETFPEVPEPISSL